MTQSTQQDRLEPATSGSGQRDINENVPVDEQAPRGVEIVNRAY